MTKQIKDVELLIFAFCNDVIQCRSFAAVGFRENDYRNIGKPFPGPLQLTFGIDSCRQFSGAQVGRVYDDDQRLHFISGFEERGAHIGAAQVARK